MQPGQDNHDRADHQELRLPDAAKANEDPRLAAADATAGSSLLGATGVGAVFALGFQLAGWGSFVPPWAPLTFESVVMSYLWMFAPMIVPAALIFAAYLATARTESRLDVRQQRGALALLAILAAFPLPPTSAFSGIYGVALILLAVRTKETFTVVVGALALIAWGSFSFLNLGWTSIPVLLLMAMAAFIAARRVQREAGGSQRADMTSGAA